MDVILLDVELKDFDEILLVAEHIDALPGIFGKVPFEYPEAVLGAKHDMVFAFIDGV